jgi:asparagine synthase (glutamine-hydrolysing)
MRLAARMPETLKLRGRVTKYVLREAMKPWLSHETLTRSKTGFGAPMRRWTRHELRPLIAELLSPGAVRSRGLFEPSEVQNLIEQNDSGRADHAYIIYALLNLELWMRTFVDRRGEEH